jgi:hypothetical protein
MAFWKGLSLRYRCFGYSHSSTRNHSARISASRILGSRFDGCTNDVMRSCLAANLSNGSSQAECAGGHPTLTPAARNLLAERIAAVDGIGVLEAHRNIDEFLRCDLTGSPQR